MRILITSSQIQKKAFVVNRVVNNRKYLIAINCLKGIVVNFYDGLVEIINWNTTG